MSEIIDVESKDIPAKYDPLPQAPAVQMIDLDEELGLVGGELESLDGPT